MVDEPALPHELLDDEASPQGLTLEDLYNHLLDDQPQGEPNRPDEYVGSPFVEIQSTWDILAGLRDRRVRLQRAIDDLDRAAQNGRELLAELDRMIGGGS